MGGVVWEPEGEKRVSWSKVVSRVGRPWSGACGGVWVPSCVRVPCVGEAGATTVQGRGTPSGICREGEQAISQQGGSAPPPVTLRLPGLPEALSMSQT
jgi:hypothetical protein